MSIFNKICKEVSPSTPQVNPSQSVTVYVPVATDSILGIAKFYSDHFVVVDGQVKLRGAWESILTAMSDVNKAKEDANNAADRAEGWAELYGFNEDGSVDDGAGEKSAKYWSDKASASASDAATSAEEARDAASATITDVDNLSETVSRNSKRITNLEQGISPDLFETDSSVSKAKIVPVNALPYAEILKVGGMTRRCENLIPYPYLTSSTTISGVTITILEDGGISVSGTSLESVNCGLWYPIKGEFGTGTYTISGGSSDVVIVARKYNSSGSNVNWIDSIGSAKSGTLTAGESVAGVNMYISSGKTVNATVYPMFNYGTTAKPYEPYFKGLRHAKVTQFVSRDGEENIIDTFEIPEEIQSLHGYGLGVDVGVANEIYSNEIAVNIETNKKEYRAYCEEIIIDGSEGRLHTSGGYKNCWCIDYRNKPRNKIMMGVTDKYKYLTGLSGTDDGAYLRITQDLLIRDARFTDTATAQDILSKNPVTVVLAFQEPIVTDVSDKFPEDNFIKVEGGGTIVAVNEYDFAVPSEIEYQIKEAE